jgi:hypothetical protein
MGKHGKGTEGQFFFWQLLLARRVVLSLVWQIRELLEMVYFEPVTWFSFEFHIELSKSPRGSDWIIPGKQLDSDYFFYWGKGMSFPYRFV